MKYMKSFYVTLCINVWLKIKERLVWLNTPKGVCAFKLKTIYNLYTVLEFRMDFFF